MCADAVCYVCWTEAYVRLCTLFAQPAGSSSPVTVLIPLRVPMDNRDPLWEAVLSRQDVVSLQAQWDQQRFTAPGGDSLCFFCHALRTGRVSCPAGVLQGCEMYQPVLKKRQRKEMIPCCYSA